MDVCWNVTSECNRNCKYCFKFTDYEVSFNDKKAILKELKDIGVKKITWGGGEPFLCEDIDKLMKIAKSYGMYNEAITNCSLLTTDNIAKKLKYVDKLNMSLDFVDDEKNSLYGIGEDYYLHFKELIKSINKKFPNLFIQVNTVVFKHNLNLLDDLYNELKKYKINRWKLAKFFPVRGSALKNKDDLYITNFEYEKEVSKFFNTKQNFEIYYNNEEKMMMKHYIVLSSGKLIISQNGEDMEVLNLLGGRNE